MKVYGVKVVEFNGSMSDKARADALAEFKSEADGTRRVLLLSSVGSTGLNLDFANVLIIVVSHSFNTRIASLTVASRTRCGR